MSLVGNKNVCTDVRGTSLLFIQRSREVELRATENKYSEWQGGGPKPGITRLRVQNPSPLGHTAF